MFAVDVFVISAQGGAPRQLTTELSSDVEPSWSHDGRWIYFLSDAHRHKTDDISRFPKVCLAFADTGSQKYVSVAGNAPVTVR